MGIVYDLVFFFHGIKCRKKAFLRISRKDQCFGRKPFCYVGQEYFFLRQGRKNTCAVAHDGEGKNEYITAIYRVTERSTLGGRKRTSAFFKTENRTFRAALSKHFGTNGASFISADDSGFSQSFQKINPLSYVFYII